MAEKKKTDIIRAPLWVRRALRTQLTALSAEGLLTFTEEAGPITSHFVVTTPLRNRKKVQEAVMRFTEQLTGGSS